MYEIEWQWFMNGTINAAGFVRALILKHGLREPDARREFKIRWAGNLYPDGDFLYPPTDQEVIKLYHAHTH